MRLTDKTIVGLTIPAGKTDAIVFDDKLPGFGLRIRQGGSRNWIFQYRSGARQHRMKIGAVASMTAARARTIAEELSHKVGLGGNPQGEKASARTRVVVTFGSAVTDYLQFREREWKPTSLRVARRYLLHHAKPLLGMELAQIDRATVATLLNKVERESGAVSANRFRARLSSCFNWCAREGLTDSNPAAFTNKRSEVSRDRVLSDGELKAIWHALPADDFGDIVKLLALTGQRRSEIADLSWNEIDFDRGLIVLPASRTKNGREHAVPMSGPVRTILDARVRVYGRELVFGVRGNVGGFSFSAPKRLLDAAVAGTITKEWVLHDLRRSVATAMADRLGIQPHIVEAILNHASGHKGGVAGVYNRAQYLGEKKQALALWADYVMAIVEGRGTNVLPMQRSG
jgi:integrase